MKVKELVQLLVQLPPDADIGVKTAWNWIAPVERVSPIEDIVECEPMIQNLWECEFIIEVA
jgi:hypothetical protein